MAGTRRWLRHARNSSDSLALDTPLSFARRPEVWRAADVRCLKWVGTAKTCGCHLTRGELRFTSGRSACFPVPGEIVGWGLGFGGVRGGGQVVGAAGGGGRGGGGVGGGRVVGGIGGHVGEV